MKRNRCVAVILMWVVAVGLCGCGSGTREKKIEFVYLALGASDATGVGATPLTDGYVFLVKRELERRMPGVLGVNFGIPGARIDSIKEQVRVAKQLGTTADLVTIWTGANDLVHGDDPQIFEKDLRFVLRTLREEVSPNIVIGNLPDLTQLPRFQRAPDARVTVAKVNAYNDAISRQARGVNAAVVDFFVQPVREEWVFGLDGFHPNDAGHREIARQFLQVIGTKLGLK
jgi:acyl-CoA thioesterase I